MSKTSLVWLLSALAVAIGSLLVYEARLLAQDGRALAAEQKRTALLTRQVSELRPAGERGVLRPGFVSSDAAAETPALPDAAESARRGEMAPWLGRLKRLQQSFDDHPDQRIPEMALLSNLDWLALARQLGDGESELDFRKLRAAVRAAATERFTGLLREALRQYTAATNGMLPADVSQLAPYIHVPIEPTAFQRYEMTATGKVPRNGHVLTERAPVDADYDTRYSVSPNGSGAGPWSIAFMRTAIDDAMKAFANANNGARPKGEADLLPFVRDPIAATLMNAMVQYGKDHHGAQSSGPADLRPYIKDPAALAKLELMFRAQDANRGK